MKPMQKGKRNIKWFSRMDSTGPINVIETEEKRGRNYRKS